MFLRFAATTIHLNEVGFTSTGGSRSRGFADGLLSSFLTQIQLSNKGKAAQRIGIIIKRTSFKMIQEEISSKKVIKYFKIT